MRQAFIFSLRIIFSGILLPFRIWQFSKEKLFSKADSKSITSLLDEDYIVTSWFDLMIDAIIFLMYPIGLLIIVMVSIFTKVSYFSFFGPFGTALYGKLSNTLSPAFINVLP